MSKRKIAAGIVLLLLQLLLFYGIERWLFS